MSDDYENGYNQGYADGKAAERVVSSELLDALKWVAARLEGEDSTMMDTVRTIISKTEGV